MKLFSRPQPVATDDEVRHDHNRRKARQRMSRLPTVEILDWADQAGSGVAKALNDFRRDGNRESLEEARIGMQALLGTVEELQSRR